MFFESFNLVVAVLVTEVTSCVLRLDDMGSNPRLEDYFFKQAAGSIEALKKLL